MNITSMRGLTAVAVRTLGGIGGALALTAAGLTIAVPAQAGTNVVNPSRCAQQGGTYSQTGTSRTCTVTTIGTTEAYAGGQETYDGGVYFFDSYFEVTRTPVTTTTTTTQHSQTTSNSTTTYTYAVDPNSESCFLSADGAGRSQVDVQRCANLNLYDPTPYIPTS